VVGKVHHPGKFLAAYEDKADLVNEQTHLVVDLDRPAGSRQDPGRIVIKQIAGLLCRRVRNDAVPGGRVERGERFGRILLGSRVDVFLPRDFRSAVRVGDKVRAGESVLGELP
jgi:phosphatidylserine decarboxylase